MIRKSVIRRTFENLEARLMLIGSKSQWPQPGIFRVLPDGSQETVSEPVKPSMSAVEIWLPAVEGVSDLDGNA